MDLRLKTYLKVAGIVFGMLALAVLSAWAVVIKGGSDVL